MNPHSLMVVAFILFLAQVTQPPAVLQSGGYEITVPHGWTAKMVARDARLEHVSGATLVVMTSRADQRFEPLTVRMAEIIANPLGFATISKPRHFRNADQE